MSLLDPCSRSASNDSAWHVAHAAATIGPDSQAPATHARVLIIDQEPHIVELLQMALRYSGYHPYTLTDAADMAQMVAAPPALLLLDAERSRHASRACMAALRNAGIPVPPIVMLTTMSRTATPPAMPGTVAVLYKPFAIQELLSIVADAITGLGGEPVPLASDILVPPAT